jgi:N-methylhydantoinase B
MYINLCWDIPWNRGVRDCIDIVTPAGTVNNCAYPAPCAMATISAVIVTIDVTWRCLSHLLLASDRYREQAMAVWSGTSMAPIFAGTSQHGFPFAATEMSHFGGGGGARTYADGVDTAGIVFNTTPNMPNIEDQEAEYPVLYLFRRHLQDSGGPGRWRGGRSGELAYTMYDAPNDHLEGLFAGTGAEMPNAIGLAGGMPGAAIRVARVVDTDLAHCLGEGRALPDSLDAIAGRREILSCKHVRTPLARGDVWYHSWQAGGGYGDPLLREPARVAEDVARRAVSVGAARRIYGVVLRPDRTADDTATAQRRQDIRSERIGRMHAGDTSGSLVLSGRGMQHYGEAVVANLDAGTITCGQCGGRLGVPGENVLPALGTFDAALSEAGAVRGEDYDEGRFALRHRGCPHCAALIDVQVALQGAPHPRLEFTFG